MAWKHFQEIVIWASKGDNVFNFLKVPAFSSLYKKKEKGKNWKWKIENWNYFKGFKFQLVPPKKKKGKKKSHHISIFSLNM